MLLLALCFSLQGSAQEVYTSSGKPPGALRKQQERKQKEQGFDPSRMIYGGSLGIGGGNGVFGFNVSPIVGYRITDKFAAGVGFGYQYTSINDYFEIEDANGFINYYDFKASIISASVWMRYLVLPRLFVHAGYEHNFLSFQNYKFDPSGSGAIVGVKEKYSAPSVLAGIGYRMPIGSNVSLYMMGMVDILQFFPNAPLYSPYYYDKDNGNILNAIYPSIGFTIGF